MNADSGGFLLAGTTELETQPIRQKNSHKHTIPPSDSLAQSFETEPMTPKGPVFVPFRVLVSILLPLEVSEK